MNNQNGNDHTRDPVRWIWRASLLLFGSVVVLNLAVAYLQPILPWLAGGVALTVAVWVLITIIRWRQSRW